VAVPTVALRYPEAVPVTPLLLALPMTVLMSAREWRSIEVSGFFLVTGARTVGTALGVTLLVFIRARECLKRLGVGGPGPLHHCLLVERVRLKS
jgi:hypothetical protein